MRRPAQEEQQTMREISQEVLDHIPNPLAKLVWEKWIQDGTARLITRDKEAARCTPQG
jgi:hypothetical protein